MSDASRSATNAAPMAMHDLSGFQRDILFVVAGLDAPSGQGVKKELEATIQDRVLPGQLYPNLDDLSEKGLVRKSDYDGRTNEYTLTDRGRQVVDDVCSWQSARIDETSI